MYKFRSASPAASKLGVSCADPEGGGGRDPLPPPPPNNIGFLSNTGPDHPEKSQSYQARIQCFATI